MTNYVANPFKSPTIISLCPGFLGLERGLQRAIGQIHIAAYVEINAFIIENLLQGMEKGVLDAAPIWTDVKTFHAAPFRGKIYGIIGGYPCQPFSVAGKQRGSEDPRHLWPYIQQHIGAIRPVWCFFENVRGHLTLGYDENYRSLRILGYAVECGIYSAEEVGAPHRRDRIFILAIREDELAHSHSHRYIQQQLSEYTAKRRQYAQCNIATSNNNELGNALCNRYGWFNEGRFQSKAQRNGELVDTESWWSRESGNENSERQGFRPTGASGNISEAELGYSNNNDGFDVQGQNAKQELNWVSNSGSSELGHTEHHGQPTEPQLRSDEAPSNEWRQEKQGTTIELEGTNRPVDEPSLSRCEDGSQWENVADTYNSRSEQDTQPSELRSSSIEQSSCNCGLTNEGENDQRRFDRWPARPGQQQYDLEAPRTCPSNAFKSSMGSEFNGYNFREDLLRAYGNSVVEQAAELAFIDLLEKHFNRK